MSARFTDEQAAELTRLAQGIDRASDQLRESPDPAAVRAYAAAWREFNDYVSGR